MSASQGVVLVVEDQVLIRMAAASLVEDAGFIPLEAASADEAIATLAARADIHMVFTDVEMPGTMDGIKLAHYVRNRWPRVLLIVASGKTIVLEDQLPIGSKFFLKPYDDVSVAAMMVAMLSSIDLTLGRGALN